MGGARGMGRAVGRMTDLAWQIWAEERQGSSARCTLGLHYKLARALVGRGLRLQRKATCDSYAMYGLEDSLRTCKVG